MEYEEFLKLLDTADNANFTALKNGYNACEACLQFNVVLREMIGVMKFKVESNNKDRNEDEEVMAAYGAQQVIVAGIAVKSGLCSHLKSIINTSQLEKMPAYTRVKEMLDANEKSDDMESFIDQSNRIFKEMREDLAA